MICGSGVPAILGRDISGTVAQISECFNFDQMADAHTQLESGRTVGKVVVVL